MAEAKKDTSLNKRRQIDRSGRVMFGWVAGASVLVGFALVIGGFLVQRIVFETKVLAEKNQMTSTLDSNIKTYDGLRDNIRVLNTNSALGSAKLNDKEDPLRVILDALPADDNSLALGASVQNLVGRVPGAKLESFQTVSSNENSSDSNKNNSSSSDNNADNSRSVQQIAFTMELSASNADILRSVLRNFEKSIRVIDIDESTIEASDSKFTMSISGHAYYLPGKTVQLNKKGIKP